MALSGHNPNFKVMVFINDKYMENNDISTALSDDSIANDRLDSSPYFKDMTCNSRRRGRIIAVGEYPWDTTASGFRGDHARLYLS